MTAAGTSSGMTGMGGKAAAAGASGNSGAAGMSGAATGAGGGTCWSSGGSGGFAGGTITPGPEGPSCTVGLVCSGKSCCDDVVVPGGTLLYCYTALPTGKTTYISAFALDTLITSVGRFRQFVNAYGSWSKPMEGQGANPQVLGDNMDGHAGAAGHSGWQLPWNAYLPKTADDLQASVASCGSASTWTSAPGDNENRPMTCLDWFTAYAFCIWDGGRLPFGSEWDYAATGGSDQRIYPWGDDPPDSTRLGANCDPKCGSCASSADVAPLGSFPAGAGKWGHLDLLGSTPQFARDGVYCADNGAPERACFLPSDTPPTSRAIWGGGSACEPTKLDNVVSTVPDASRAGVRCARQPP